MNISRQSHGKPRRSSFTALVCAIVAASLLLPPSTSSAFAENAPPSSVEKHTKQQKQARKFYEKGVQQLTANDPVAAAESFARALEIEPANPVYFQAHELARQHQVSDLVHAAEKAQRAGDEEQRTLALQQALKLDPANPIVTQHIEAQALEAQLRQPGVLARLEPPPEFTTTTIDLKPSAKLQSFHFRANSQDALRKILAAYGITPVFDSSVASRSVRLDVDDFTFTQAADTARLLTGTFFTPLDETRVLIAKDTPQNRTKFERLMLETVYLPGLASQEVTEVGGLLKNLFDLKQIAVAPSSGTVTIRAPQSSLQAINRVLIDLLDGKAQVLLELNLFQIARTKTRDIGVQLPQQFTAVNVGSELSSIISQNQSTVDQLIASGVVQAGDTTAIIEALIALGLGGSSVLSGPFALFGGGLTLTGLTLGSGATANFALNSSDTRAIDKLQLRVGDQETATFRSGSRYPIITQSYSSATTTNSTLSSLLSQFGVSNSSTSGIAAAIPNVQYEDIGLTLKATPRVQRNGDVSMKIEFKIESLSGSMLNSIPVLDQRQFTSEVSVRQGTAALLVSTLSRTETGAVNGIPGLSELPGLGGTTNKDTERDYSELVMVITPHIVRSRGSSIAGPMVTLPLHP